MEINISTKNSTYQKFVVLQSNRNKRYRYNEFLVEGVRSLNEAVKNHWKIKREKKFLKEKCNILKMSVLAKFNLYF